MSQLRNLSSKFPTGKHITEDSFMCSQLVNLIVTLFLRSTWTWLLLQVTSSIHRIRVLLSHTRKLLSNADQDVPVSQSMTAIKINDSSKLPLILQMWNKYPDKGIVVLCWWHHLESESVQQLSGDGVVFSRSRTFSHFTVGAQSPDCQRIQVQHMPRSCAPRIYQWDIGKFRWYWSFFKLWRFTTFYNNKKKRQNAWIWCHQLNIKVTYFY